MSKWVGPDGETFEGETRNDALQAARDWYGENVSLTAQPVSDKPAPSLIEEMSWHIAAKVDRSDPGWPRAAARAAAKMMLERMRSYKRKVMLDRGVEDSVYQFNQMCINAFARENDLE